jgi:predicted nuclease of predicted toxin-antitoxin system
MKLLLDQGIPRSTAALLCQVGLDAVHTGEIGLAEAADEEILRRALVESRVVVTFDADFHALLALSQAGKPSVVRIRIEGLQAEDVCRLLHEVTRQCSEDLERGAMLSVQENRIRVHRLPVA